MLSRLFRKPRRKLPARPVRSCLRLEALEDRCLLSFGIGGLATPTPDGGSWGLLQSDGKILATGAITSNNGAMSFFVTRLNADGSLDTSFGSQGTGKVSTSNTGGSDNYSALQANGAIV